MKQPGKPRVAPPRVRAAVPPLALSGHVWPGISNGKATAAFDEETVIFGQGEAANALFNIQKGKIKLTVVSKTGKEAVIAVLGPGDFFGEGCLAGQPLRMSTATAMTRLLDPAAGESHRAQDASNRSRFCGTRSCPIR